MRNLFVSFIRSHSIQCKKKVVFKKKLIKQKFQFTNDNDNPVCFKFSILSISNKYTYVCMCIFYGSLFISIYCFTTIKKSVYIYQPLKTNLAKANMLEKYKILNNSR